MSDPDSQKPLSILSENSYVILGQGSLPGLTGNYVNEDPNSDSSLKSKSAFTVYKSADSKSSDKFLSLSEEETQRKLNELVNENSQLKETLNRNNLAIKSQLDTFIMWQQEVLKTHETHKQKFLETKDLILKLRAENTCLKKHLKESSLWDPAVNGNEIYAYINKKPEDLDNLKQAIEEYKHTCNNLNSKNENLEAENHKLKEELRSTKNDVFKLNKELEDLGRENIFLKHKSDSKSKSTFEGALWKSLPSSEAHAQINNLLKQLEHEKEKVIKLTKKLEKTESKDSEMQCSKLNTTDKLNQCIDELNNMNDSFDMQSQRYSSFSSWVSLAELNLKENNVSEEDEANFVCEVGQLKSHLNQEENMFREKQESLLELKKQFHKLLEDYKALQAKLTSLKRDNSNIKKYKEEISSLLNKLEVRDKELISKQQECNKLKETIQYLSLKCEEIALSRVQFEVYQSDFNDELERENLAKEKEEMAEQIQFLQSRIKVLESGNFKKDNSVTSPLNHLKKKNLSVQDA